MATPKGYKGYSSYRGRQSAGRIALAIILILVIVAAAGFLILQKYIVYDESGMPYFKMPEKTGAEASTASSAASGSASAAGDDDLKITIDDKPTDGAGTASSSQIYQLGRMPLTDWDTVHTHLAEIGMGSSALALTVKDASGTVYYDSLVAAEVSGRAVKVAADTTASITAMTASGVPTVARLSCFLDPLAANADLEGMGLKNTGGYIFYDGNSQNWLDPSKAPARQYLCNLAVECAKMGFREILLTNVSYPTEGKLNKIDYGATLKNENLALFLTDLRAALKDYDVTVSLELPAAVIISGSDENAGQVLGELSAHVDRIYAVTTAEQAPSLSAAVKAANADVAFVPEVTAPGDLASYVLVGG